MNVNNLPDHAEAVKIAERIVANDKSRIWVVVEFWNATDGCRMEFTAYRDGRITDARKLPYLTPGIGRTSRPGI